MHLFVWFLLKLAVLVLAGLCTQWKLQLMQYKAHTSIYWIAVFLRERAEHFEDFLSIQQRICLHLTRCWKWTYCHLQITEDQQTVPLGWLSHHCVGKLLLLSTEIEHENILARAALKKHGHAREPHLPIAGWKSVTFTTMFVIRIILYSHSLESSVFSNNL